MEGEKEVRKLEGGKEGRDGGREEGGEREGEREEGKKEGRKEGRDYIYSPEIMGTQRYDTFIYSQNNKFL